MVAQASYTVRQEQESKPKSERQALENKAEQARTPETLKEIKVSYDRFKREGGVELYEYYGLKTES
jgi:hypothetical protein